MVKRKRESTGPSAVSDSGAKSPEENPEQEASSSTHGRDRKRRKLSSTKSSDPTDICAELYDVIRNYRTEDGRVLCEALIRVPKRRTSPEYYEVVSSPIDLLKIQQRLKTDEYEDVETFVQDVELLLDNALKFYKPEMQEYKDAEQLKQVFEEEKESILNIKDDDQLDDVILDDKDDHDDDDESDTGMKTQHKEKGASSKQTKNQQEYYEVIKEPIDLKIICTRVRNHHYCSVEDLEKDLQLMVKNAHTFNEPGSQVYKVKIITRAQATPAGTSTRTQAFQSRTQSPRYFWSPNVSSWRQLVVTSCNVRNEANCFTSLAWVLISGTQHALPLSMIHGTHLEYFTSKVKMDSSSQNDQASLVNMAATPSSREETATAVKNDQVNKVYTFSRKGVATATKNDQTSKVRYGRKPF
ncbi:Protein polybromo-1 [Exaiptasia diaphana]|nr:Protein polybromo-1 [Exaiptasia diaphana]